MLGVQEAKACVPALLAPIVSVEGYELTSGLCGLGPAVKCGGERREWLAALHTPPPRADRLVPTAACNTCTRLNHECGYGGTIGEVFRRIPRA